eukprot:TRINITY_DN12967_c0_g1_i1.p1 TRINITY_DN12967_c0_g1~~TRINITY_DN12967_c0_g1_i1.p1  ORF type:complete len:746 (+),score=182.40 TRINITY_DN12967_c0_g1_i1:205-2238(+)
MDAATGDNGDFVWPSTPSEYSCFRKFARSATKNRVWKAKVGDREVTIRTISTDPNVSNLDAVVKKVETLRDVPHPNVMKVLHYFLIDHSIWLVYPAGDWITLNGLMVAERPAFDESVIACMMAQVLDVLLYLHSRGEAWFDIRPVHLLLEENGMVRVVLHSLRSIVQQKTRDSLPYVAPEQLAQIDEQLVDVSRMKADVWALGVTAVALFIAHAPFEQLSLPEITARIHDGSPIDEIPDSTAISPSFGRFLEMALEPDMKARATAEQLLNSGFITNAPGIDYVAQQLSPEVARFKAANPPPAASEMPHPKFLAHTPVAEKKPLPSVDSVSSFRGVGGGASLPNLTAVQLGKEPRTPATLSASGSATTSVAPTHPHPHPVGPPPLPGSLPPLRLVDGTDGNSVSSLSTASLKLSMNPEVGGGGGSSGGSGGSGAGSERGNGSGEPSSVGGRAHAHSLSVGSPRLNPLRPGHQRSQSQISVPFQLQKQQRAELSQKERERERDHQQRTKRPHLERTSLSVETSPIPSPSPPPPLRTRRHHHAHHRHSDGRPPRELLPEDSSAAPPRKTSAAADDVPIETYLGETPTEFVVLVRAIPGTQVRLELRARSMLIHASLPPLNIARYDLLAMHSPQRLECEKKVLFPSYVNANNYSKSYDKSASLLTVRIRKFSSVELGSETF